MLRPSACFRLLTHATIQGNIISNVDDVGTLIPVNYVRYEDLREISSQVTSHTWYVSSWLKATAGIEGPCCEYMSNLFVARVVTVAALSVVFEKHSPHHHVAKNHFAITRLELRATFFLIAFTLHYSLVVAAEPAALFSPRLRGRQNEPRYLSGAITHVLTQDYRSVGLPFCPLTHQSSASN